MSVTRHLALIGRAGALATPAGAELLVHKDLSAEIALAIAQTAMGPARPTATACR
jgi:hypothetical protein